MKIFNPNVALGEFDEHGKSIRGAQPGKMACIYFQPFEKIKHLKGKNYTLEDYHQENFNIIKKIEQYCHEYHLTPGDPPEGGLPARSFEFENDRAAFVYVSGKERDRDGKYIDAKMRSSNDEAENPYTNPKILSWERAQLESSHSSPGSSA